MPKVHKQGNVIVEENDGEFLIMFPDGTVEVRTSKAKAERKIKSWLSADLTKRGGGIGIAVTEWR